MKKSSVARKSGPGSSKVAAKKTVRAKATSKVTRKKSSSGAKSGVTPTQRKASAKRTSATARKSTTAGKPATARKATARKATAGRKATTARKAPTARKAAATRKNTKALEGRERIHAALEDFSTVMMVTRQGESVRVRPMAVSELTDDCTMTFMTAVESAKVREAQKEPTGWVIAQSSATFLSIEGTYEIVDDRARVDALWKPIDKVYFPNGKDDPSIRLMVFRPGNAEIWDVSGTKGLTYLYEAAKALITGTRPHHEDDQHDIVKLAQA